MPKKTHFAPNAMEFHIQTSHSMYTVILISSTSGAGTTYPSAAHEFKFRLWRSVVNTTLQFISVLREVDRFIPVFLHQ